MTADEIPYGAEWMNGKPWNLVISTSISVFLDVMDGTPTVIHTASSVAEAIEWAASFMSDLGLDLYSDTEMHERLGHKFIVMYPLPKGVM